MENRIWNTPSCGCLVNYFRSNDFLKQQKNLLMEVHVQQTSKIRRFFIAIN
jgi:hypothetical protein